VRINYKSIGALHMMKKVELVCNSYKCIEEFFNCIFFFCKLVSILKPSENLQSVYSRCQQCLAGKPLLALVQKYSDICPKM